MSVTILHTRGCMYCGEEFNGARPRMHLDYDAHADCWRTHVLGDAAMPVAISWTEVPTLTSAAPRSFNRPAHMTLTCHECRTEQDHALVLSGATTTSIACVSCGHVVAYTDDGATWRIDARAVTVQR